MKINIVPFTNSLGIETVAHVINCGSQSQNELFENVSEIRINSCRVTQDEDICCVEWIQVSLYRECHVTLAKPKKKKLVHITSMKLTGLV